MHKAEGREFNLYLLEARLLSVGITQSHASKDKGLCSQAVLPPNCVRNRISLTSIIDPCSFYLYRWLLVYGCLRLLLLFNTRLGAGTPQYRLPESQYSRRERQFQPYHRGNIPQVDRAAVSVRRIRFRPTSTSDPLV